MDNYDFETVYESLTEGQKQHMANRLWKREGIAAAALKPKFESPEPGSWWVLAEEDKNLDPFILAAAGNNRALLINTNSGYRWADAVTVSSTRAITEGEWQQITVGVKFKRYPK